MGLTVSRKTAKTLVLDVKLKKKVTTVSRKIS